MGFGSPPGSSSLGWRSETSLCVFHLGRPPTAWPFGTHTVGAAGCPWDCFIKPPPALYPCLAASSAVSCLHLAATTREVIFSPRCFLQHLDSLAMTQCLQSHQAGVEEHALAGTEGSEDVFLGGRRGAGTQQQVGWGYLSARCLLQLLAGHQVPKGGEWLVVSSLVHAVGWQRKGAVCSWARASTVPKQPVHVPESHNDDVHEEGRPFREVLC